MKNYTVEDLLVPISEYATVSLGTTLFEAILELDQAQADFYHGKYQSRGILVLDSQQKVAGRISQHRILKAVEDGEVLEDFDKLKKFKFSDIYIDKLREKLRLDKKIFTKETLQAAAKKKVEEFMQKPTPDEYVSVSSSLDMAVHKLLTGSHLSLLVTNGEEIVGVLRMADVFAATFHEMKELGIEQ